MTGFIYWVLKACVYELGNWILLKVSTELMSEFKLFNAGHLHWLHKTCSKTVHVFWFILWLWSSLSKTLNFACYLVIKQGFEGRRLHGRGVGVCESGGNFDKAFKAAEK